MPLSIHSSRGPLNAGRALLAGLLAGAAFTPTPASAGSYVIYSCQHPDGSRAPADGWAANVSGDGQASTCGPERASTLLVLPNGSHAAGAYAQWVWAGKSEVPLRAFTVRRSYQVSESIGPGTT